MEKKVYIDLPPFRNVPIKEIAQAIGKDPHYIRLAIQQGIFKFGVAMKVGNSNEFSYYCPDRKVWEETGYFRDVRKEKAQACQQNCPQGSPNCFLMFSIDQLHFQ